VLTLEHFHDKPDSFRLPRIRLVVTDSKKHSPWVLVSGGDVIADDIRTYRRRDHSQSSLLQLKFDNNSDHIMSAMEDCKVDKEIEDTYGADLQEEIPLLETLCIRQLHRQECEYAIGESDGAVIQYNYLKACADHKLDGCTLKVGNICISSRSALPTSDRATSKRTQQLLFIYRIHGILELVRPLETLGATYV